MKALALRATTCVLAVVLVASPAPHAAAQWGAASDPRNLIHTSGTAEIRVAPDEVNLRLGIETRSPELDQAVTQNDAKTAAVLKFFKDNGIAAKDVQTDFVEIQPHYFRDREQQAVTPEFYSVRRNFGVRLRKVAQFDALLTGSVKSGINHVLGIEFRTTELRKHRDAARQQAIRAARQKAEALAGELGVAVGKPTNIQENTGAATGAGRAAATTWPTS